MTIRGILLIAWLSLSVALRVLAEDGGALKGVIKFDGAAPAPRMIPLKDYQRGECRCIEMPDDSLVVDPATNGIRWAVIRIMDVQPKDAPPKPEARLSIDQKDCHYSPHILIVPPGTSVDVLNPDRIMNNCHSLPYDSEDPCVNSAIGADRAKFEYKGEWLKHPDIVEIKSDMYPWMKAFFVVHDPRFCAVSGTDGTFEIKNVPPGNYTVKIFQQTFSEMTLDVEIKPGAATDLGDVKFTPPKK